MRALPLTLTLSLLLTSIALFGQSDRAGIDKTMRDYFRALYKMDVETLLDYSHPELFEYVPREKLAEVFKSVLQNPLIDLGMADHQIIAISDVVVHEEVKYALVDYSFTMTFAYTDAPEPEVYEKLGEQFKEKYGKKNVTFNKNTGKYYVFRQSQLFAVKGPGYDGWKVVENSEKDAQFKALLIPAEVQKALEK